MSKPRLRKRDWEYGNLKMRSSLRNIKEMLHTLEIQAIMQLSFWKRLRLLISHFKV
jgi:hypothetical protein